MTMHTESIFKLKISGRGHSGFESKMLCNRFGFRVCGSLDYLNKEGNIFYCWLNPIEVDFLKEQSRVTAQFCAIHLNLRIFRRVNVKPRALNFYYI